MLSLLFDLLVGTADGRVAFLAAGSAADHTNMQRCEHRHCLPPGQWPLFQRRRQINGFYAAIAVTVAVAAAAVVRINWWWCFISHREPIANLTDCDKNRLTIYGFGQGLLVRLLTFVTIAIHYYAQIIRIRDCRSCLFAPQH